MLEFYLWIVFFMTLFDIIRWVWTENKAFIPKPTFLNMLITSIVCNAIIGIIFMTLYKFFTWLFA